MLVGAFRRRLSIKQGRSEQVRGAIIRNLLRPLLIQWIVRS